MLGLTAKRSSDSAAAMRRNLRVLADGAESCQIAEQQPRDRVDNAQTQCSYTTPQGEGGEISGTSENRGQIMRVRWRQLVIAAGALWATNSDPPAANRNVGSVFVARS